MTSSGQLTSTSTDIRFEFGPAYPVYPDPSVPQADSTCASNPMCTFMGFNTGNCCPNANGVYNGCEFHLECTMSKIIHLDCVGPYFSGYLFALLNSFSPPFHSGCSFCAMPDYDYRPSCAKYAMDNTTMCCPSNTGMYDPCCDVKPKALRSQANETVKVQHISSSSRKLRFAL
jgi:hypothetical protein